MNYFDHDEKEKKRMRNSSGLVSSYHSADSGDNTDAEEVAAADVMKEAYNWPHDAIQQRARQHFV